MGEQGSGAEIEGAIKDGEQEGIGIEGGERKADRGEGLGEAKEGFEAGKGVAGLGVFEETFAEGFIAIGEGAGLVVVGLEAGGGEIEECVRGSREPVGLLEEEPAVVRDVAELVAELGQEALGVAPVGEIEGVLIAEAGDAVCGGRVGGSGGEEFIEDGGGTFDGAL
jgi:hypothetical protein